VSCSTSQTTDNLVSFSSSDKVIKDSGISAWLPLAGGTMSGNINMGTNPVATNNIIIGDTNTASTSTNCTLVGNSTISDSIYVSALGSGCPYSTSAGFLSYCVDSDSGVAIGNSRCISNPGGVAIGYSNTAGATGSISIGTNFQSFCHN